MTDDPCRARFESELAAAREEAMEFACIGLLRLRFDGTVLFADRAATRMLGGGERLRAPAGAVGRRLSSLLDWTGPPEELRWDLRTRRRVRNREVRFRTLAGEERWVLLHAYVAEDPASGEDIVQAILHDITDRKRVEAALRKSEAKTKAVLDAVPDLMFRLSADGTVQEYVSGGPQPPLAAPERVVGGKVRELVPLMAEHVELAIRKVLAGGTSCSLEYALRRGDEVRYFETRHVPCDGEVLSIVRDITERKRAEEAHRRSEASFGRLLERAPVAVLVVHREGQILYANEAALSLFGRRREEDLVGRTFASLGPTERHEQLARRMRAWFASPTPSRDPEVHLERADGGSFVAEVAAVPHEFYGQPASVVMFHDLTELRRMQEERLRLEARVQRSQRLESLEVLAGGIAHDFNNLLTGVLGNASLALAEPGVDGAVEPRVRSIRIAAQRAADLTKELLAYSGRGRFVVEVVDLSELLGEMVQLLGAAISKKATLRTALHRDPLLVEADATQLRQVFMNLVTNASDALGDTDGEIWLRTGLAAVDGSETVDTCGSERLPPGRYAYVEVEDSGCGMAPETVSRIFDPFFTTKFTGRGLGLAAALGIVRSHGGALQVRSAPGRGTTFRVWLPPTDRPREEVEPLAPEEGRLGGRTVLVVDDEATVREVASVTLERAGFTVLTACDGQEALEVFAERGEAVAAVLLDMTMPRLGGAETFRALRERAPRVPVVLTSGFAEHDAVTRFGEAGLAGFLQKPFVAGSLTREIGRAIETAQRR